MRHDVTVMDAPAGLVTFLFTDIEGSSRLWEQVPDRMRSALARHDALARGAVERHRGRVVKMLGDGMHAVFDVPSDAIEAIVELQLALAEPPGSSELPLRIRCGVHVGDVERRDNDFFGSVVNRAARIMSVAHGGQVLLSHAVAAQVTGRLPQGVTLRDLGTVRLRDLARPERVYQLLHPKLRQDFPALRSLESTPNNLPQQVTSFVGRDRELAELRRREDAYRGGREPIPLRGRDVVLVDDGLATGATMRAAVAAVRRQDPASLTVAVPVGSPRVCAELQPEVDRVVCLDTPAMFRAVGQAYRDFSATEDAEVVTTLDTARTRGR